MASLPSGAKVDAVKGANRTSSIDSAVSAISSRAPSQQGSLDDVAILVRAAGSPEAVIQYLLKEKHSQSQQNAQLWRLVDKQRAMILGLNKDLDRALKDKEKYRKKLKEVIAIHDDHARIEFPQSRTGSLATIDTKVSETEPGDAPGSPSNLDSYSPKHSPIDETCIPPYPITPPADRLPCESSSKLCAILDPAHAIRRDMKHTLDQFDHEEQDCVADGAENVGHRAHELSIHIGRAHSRSPPHDPCDASQSELPTLSIIAATPLVDQGFSQFPTSHSPPPRKPPPAPLQLNKEPIITNRAALDEAVDSESDYDSLLDADDIPTIQARGRRRTREDDDREREVIAQREAEARSVSKKSKKPSQKGTPRSDDQSVNLSASAAPASSRPEFAHLSPNMRDHIPASLAGVLNGDGSHKKLYPPLMSPGLPASPRPMNFSPPSSPRNFTTGAIPLSPRAPRQPIPLPPPLLMPNTPRFQPMPTPQSCLTATRPNLVVKQIQESAPIERTEIYRGFATEEYPDLLLPPNALPSVAVKVASSRMKPSRASLMSFTQLEEDPVFTLAILSRSEGGELWRVEKDTSSLAKLDSRMKQCSSFTAKTPDRSLFSGHAPAKLDARRTILDNYLDELLNTSLDLATAVELCKYLSTNALPPNCDDTLLSVDVNGEINQKKGPGGRPFKTGYLTKRGKNFGGWKARYFVLDGPNLKYYETPGGTHLGTIRLMSAQIGKQAQQSNDGSSAAAPNPDDSDNNQYRHAFLVLEQKKKDTSSYVKHVLCAESDQERDQWVDVLLRWIDYRDDEKMAAKSGAHSQGHATGANSKKKAHGQGKIHEQSNESQDALVGMSYDATKQGDLPDGLGPQRRGTTSPEPPEKVAASASTYSISGPKDPYIISDSASWGSKTALVPPAPTVEEKKARKRSFFGFGPKARSSDDQDVLGCHSSGGSTPQLQSERGPVRQAFGAPLGEAVRYCPPTDANVPLPAVVYRCIQYLDLKNAIEEEGIFRLSGSSVVIKQLRERFNTEGDVNLMTDENYYDIHAVASLLKLYLRELPTTILTRDLHMQFITVMEMTNHTEKIEALSELVQHLPQANETLLKYLSAFLIKIINHSDMNKMTIRNVGIVFSPTLNIPAPVFALILQNYRGIFGIEPEDYELPSPVAEPDVRPDSRPDSRPLSELPPRRPSTAGPTESPHRQRLVDQTQKRSTPTPPPTASTLGLRATGTPPPRHVHEASSDFDAPGPATPNSKPAAYDRTTFSYGPGYDQESTSTTNGMLDASFGNKAKRRESAMFMATPMQHQTSNSRLREETKM